MKKYDVLIIGGGVIGSSIAFQLSKQGKKVAILEKNRLASEASSAAAGMLGAQAELEEEIGPLFELAIKSRALFPHLAEELREISGIDIGLVQRGMLKVALTDCEAEKFKKIVQCQQAAGETAEWLDTEEVKKREAHLSSDIKGAIYIPKDGQVLAPDLSLAFAKSAAILGAEIYEFTKVNALLRHEGRVSGVLTDSEAFFADKVVIASGAWSSQLLKDFPLKQQVFPVKGECISVITHKPLVESTIFSHGCYLVPKKGGRLLVGATMIEHTFDKKVSVEGVSQLLTHAQRLLPAISSAEWEASWAGLRPQTANGLPILGVHPEFQGLYVAAGHYRNGILLSPLTGILMADLLAEKDEAKAMLAPFALQSGIKKRGVVG
ncbi:glycine oxidase ThiO [Heyndrickxia acidicola]|uniref:glycine oxidase n=1 Tax=Heyndrickxia acidicola TaxID=209389 RepID=A0ABU6MHT8_9BACI|nr:glycine oxidase ThiO [Heyndrickxia acidicola]MED1203571.1 glycine oxidase ThiO [Heyndrickxia acidicola]